MGIDASVWVWKVCAERRSTRYLVYVVALECSGRVRSVECLFFDALERRFLEYAFPKDVGRRRSGDNDLLMSPIQSDRKQTKYTTRQWSSIPRSFSSSENSLGLSGETWLTGLGFCGAGPILGEHGDGAVQVVTST